MCMSIIKFCGRTRAVHSVPAEDKQTPVGHAGQLGESVGMNSPVRRKENIFIMKRQETQTSASSESAAERTRALHSGKKTLLCFWRAGHRPVGTGRRRRSVRRDSPPDADAQRPKMILDREETTDYQNKTAGYPLVKLHLSPRKVSGLLYCCFAVFLSK